MGMIFLSGGGDKKHTEKFDQEFKRQIGSLKPLLYIPVAMKGMISFEDCYQWMKSVFKPLGLREIVMWTDLSQKSLKDLQQFSAIYIGGGNTFSLIKDMRSSAFDEILKDYIKSGGVVYGGSAGAIVLGSDIMTCAHLDSNEVNLKNYNGLNMISDLAIWCHYKLQDDEHIRNYMQEYKKPVLALSEETGAYFSGKGIKITGTKPAHLFRKENKVDVLPGSEYPV